MQGKGQLLGVDSAEHPVDLVGTSWRSKGRKRKRRQTRVEKMLYSPRGEGGGRGGDGEGLQSSDEDLGSDSDSVIEEEMGGTAAGGGVEAEIANDVREAEEGISGREEEKEEEEGMVSKSSVEVGRTAPPAPVARKPAVYLPVKRDAEIQVWGYQY